MSASHLAAAREQPGFEGVPPAEQRRQQEKAIIAAEKGFAVVVEETGLTDVRIPRHRLSVFGVVELVAHEALELADVGAIGVLVRLEVAQAVQAHSAPPLLHMILGRRSRSACPWEKPAC